jgi:plasmid stabilization system protein ParE
MNYRVEMSDRASADLERILQDLSDRSLKAAAQLSARFDEGLARLETNPLTCGLAYENSSFDEEIRHLLFFVRKRRTYRALFVVRDENVVVLTVRAPGEKPITPEEGFA